MSRHVVNLICAELPGTEKELSPRGEDLWTAAHRSFARVGDEAIEVREGGGWAALPRGLSNHDLRERIVAAYEAARDALPGDVQATLDRTSG